MHSFFHTNQAKMAETGPSLRVQTVLTRPSKADICNAFMTNLR